MSLEQISLLLDNADVQGAAKFIRENANQLNGRKLEALLAEKIPLAKISMTDVLSAVDECYDSKVSFNSVVKATENIQWFTAVEIVRSYKSRISKSNKRRVYKTTIAKYLLTDDSFLWDDELKGIIFDAGEVFEAAELEKLVLESVKRRNEKSELTEAVLYELYDYFNRKGVKYRPSFNLYLNSLDISEDNSDSVHGFNICRRCSDAVSTAVYERFWARAVVEKFNNQEYEQGWELLRDERINFENASSIWTDIKPNAILNYDAFRTFLKRQVNTATVEYERLLVYCVAAQDKKTVLNLIKDFRLVI